MPGKHYLIAKKNNIITHYLFWAFLCCLNFSCAPKPVLKKPPIEKAESFSYTGNQVIPQKWWTSFNNKQLNKLLDTAFAHNLNLAATWQQFQEASAIRNRERSFLLPDIEASARSGISRPKPDFAGGENVQLGLNAAYEVDLWGRIRANVQAEEYRMQASFFDYQTAAMSLSAEITTTFFQIITVKEQLKLVNQQIETNKDIIKLIKIRFGAGQIRGVDILRQTQLLKESQDQKTVYETNLAILKNQLAVLIGRPPQNFTINTSNALPPLPPKPKTGLPLELVRRRPDIKSAYSDLLAADRDMAVAVRNKFPRLSLNLSTQARSNNYNNLFQDWAYTLAGNILAPILYWGRLRDEVDRTQALKNRFLFQYGQTVLTAFREVEDALIREEKLAQRLEILQERIEMAQKTNQQLKIEFINGLSEYLDVLLALDQEQQLRRDMLEARQEQFEIRISLYRSFAGSFETGRENNQNQ